MTCDTRAGL